MKKKRTIIIKNPNLQKIRNNLRTILINWQSKEWNLLHDEYTKIHYDQAGRVRASKELSKHERLKVGRIQEQMKIIDDILDSSICKCTVCGASEKNMTFNPVAKKWFCVDCYKLNQDYYKDTDEAFLYP